MVSVQFYEAYIRTSMHSHDTNIAVTVERFNTCQASVALFLSHDDGDVFFYADALFCDDIQTLFLLDFYGFSFHSWEERVEFSTHDTIDLVQEVLVELKEAVRTLYGYRVQRYNKGLFRRYTSEIVDQTRWKCQALASRLPWDIVDHIYDRVIPAWTQCRRIQWRNQWKHQKAVRDDYGLAYEYFFQRYSGFAEAYENASPKTVYTATLANVRF